MLNSYLQIVEMIFSALKKLCNESYKGFTFAIVVCLQCKDQSFEIYANIYGDQQSDPEILASLIAGSTKRAVAALLIKQSVPFNPAFGAEEHRKNDPLQDCDGAIYMDIEGYNFSFSFGSIPLMQVRQKNGILVEIEDALRGQIANPPLTQKDL